jgi:predicted DNA binding CopG/RHH family protein
MAETKKSQKLSLKPSVQKTSVREEAAAWVESRNGAELPISTVQEEANNPKSKRVTFEVTEAQHQEIKIRATKKGMTIKEYMIALVEEELKR